MSHQPAFDLFSFVTQTFLMHLMGGLCAAGGILFILIVVDGLRQGAILDLKRYNHDHNRLSRDTDPITFWFYVITDCFLGISGIFSGCVYLRLW